MLLITDEEENTNFIFITAGGQQASDADRCSTLVHEDVSSVVPLSGVFSHQSCFYFMLGCTYFYSSLLTSTVDNNDGLFSN